MFKTTIIIYFCRNINFVKMRRVIPIFLFLFSAYLMKSQIPITDFYPMDSLYADFNEYNASGFQPTPTFGQIGSNEVSIRPGGSNPILYYGGTQTSGVYAKGITGNAQTAGGFYAFRIDPLDTANRAFGFQQTGTFMGGINTTGEIQFRFENLTGKPIYKMNFSYDIYVRNDQPRSSSIKIKVGNDTNNLVPVSAGNYLSPLTAGVGASWALDANYNLLLNNLTIPVGGEFYFSFLIKDSLGSGSRDELAIDNFKIYAIDSINTNPSVIVNAGFSANDSAVCAGTTVTFTNTTTTLPANTPLLYFWDFKDGGIDSVANTSHLFDSAGIYNVTLYAIDTISFALDSHVVSIQVFETPNPNFTATPSVGNPAQYIINPSGTNPNVSFQLFVNGVPNALVGAAPFLFTFPSIGNYNVCLKATNSIGTCSDSTCKTIAIAGIETIKSKERIELHPNPANDFISIDNLKEKVSVKIFNAIGQLVKEEILSSNANKMNVKELQAGLYLVAIKSSSTSKIIRLVVQ
jgi:hypothetical protein